VASILIKEGPANGQELLVDSELVLGRENADLTIDDSELSRRHARIKPIDGVLEIEDLGSMNGTWVNGNRIPEPTRLSPGDTVKVGTTVIQVLTDPVPEPVEEEPEPEPEPDAFPKEPKTDTVVEGTVVGAPEALGGRTPAASSGPLPPVERVEPREQRLAPEDDWLLPDPPPQPAEPVAPLERTAPVEDVLVSEPVEAVPAARDAVAAPVPAAVQPPGRRNLEWLAAAGAFPFTLLTLAAVIMLATKAPHPGAKKPEFLAFFAHNQGKVLLAFALITLAVWFFIPYLALLWRTLRLAEGEPAWLSAVLFAAGISMATLAVAQNAFWGAAAHRAKDGLSPDLARTLFDLGTIFYMAWLPLSVFLVAGAILTFQTGVFPRWLGWMAGIASPLVLMSAYPGGPIAKQIIEHVGLISWFIWTVATGWILMKRARVPRALPDQNG
jgi:hypothetical protein